MGACCSCHTRIGRAQGFFIDEEARPREVEDDENIIFRGDGGARIRLQGWSRHVSLHSQQGRKGVNQDAMTVWERFSGERDMFMCSVFDGHGPSGHKVAQYCRDFLPAKISAHYERSRDDDQNQSNNDDGNENLFFVAWKDRLINCFKEMDDDLEADSSVESYCSGTTSVTVLKKGEHLVVANLGDSRAVLCTRDGNNELVPEQLTVDLKPNIPEERERITSCQGRVLAMEEEPKVFRIWLPDQNCPGLAMARAFGDFCLKDYGLISTPQVTYRKLTEKDEFVVLATDGIWDALSNTDVIRIVASARNRSMAAKLLVDEAVKAWRYKFPCAKTDDCAAVCLFFKRQRPLLTKSISQVTHLSLNYKDLGPNSYENNDKIDDGLDTVLNCDFNGSPGDSNDQLIKRPRRKRPTREVEYGGE
ncbi:hypothetical protein ACS0TY_016202 [Phlomoides rotata]